MIINGAEGRELRDARWGMPSSKKALLDAATKRAEKLRAKGKGVDVAELLGLEPEGHDQRAQYRQPALEAVAGAAPSLSGSIRVIQ